MRVDEEFDAYALFDYEEVQAAECISAPVGNYYGGPEVWALNGKYYLSVENYSGHPTVEVSKEFHDAFAKEFGGE